MKEFKFYQDVKVTIWQRQYFEVEAESKEEALSIAKEYKDCDVSSDISPYDTEYLYETEELLTPEENGYNPTIELYDAETNLVIGTNAERAQELIGYQVLNLYCEYPNDLNDHDVFRTEQDAQEYIDTETADPNKWYVKPRFAEDEDDQKRLYCYHGKKPRAFKKGERVFNCEESAGDQDLRDWAVVCEDTKVEYEDEIVLLTMDSGSENETDADSVYQVVEGKVCPRCGGQICYEHHDEIDYPYYCPECDENFCYVEL